MPDGDFFARFFNKAKTSDADKKRKAIISEAGNSNDFSYLVALIGELN